MRLFMASPVQQVAGHLGKLPLSAPDKEPTLFDALEPPEVPVGDYLEWLCRGFGCTEECAVLAAIYMKRSGVKVTAYSVHRLVLGCMVLAVKYRDDTYYSDVHYAKVGGVDLQEVGRIVRELLTLLDWHLHVSVPEYNSFLSSATTAATTTVAFTFAPRTTSMSSISTESTLPSSTPCSPLILHRRRPSLTENILKLFCLA